MKRLVYLLVLMLTANWTFAQKNTANNSPQTQVKVNKEYDENGNLTRYDSTYVSSWSSDSTFILMDMDSLGNQMGFFFGNQPEFFKLDSAFFGGNDPFKNLHQDFFKQHNEMMKHFGFGEMDSTMDSFPDFSSAFPDLDEMRKQMEEQFKQFFGDDSIHTQFKGVQ